MLEIINLSKTYPNQEKPAVKEVSLKIREGEFFTLTGESGSGKSTLLRLIKGLEDADSGQILFDGNPVKGPSQKLIAGEEGIELAHQNYNLFPRHTVYENIQYVVRYLPDEAQEQKIGELLRIFKLEEYKDKIPGTLSGGQQQRVAIAKALAAAPRLLLLDEPFSNLDMILRTEIKSELADYLRRHQSSVLFVTHESPDALSLSDRIAVMKNGALVQTGTPQEIYHQPATPYIASYFGNANIVRVQDLESLRVHASRPLPPESFVCIRYEDIRITDSGQANLVAKVARSDYFGACYRLEVHFNKLKLWLYSNSPALKKGDQVSLLINTEKIHLFEHPETLTV
jgi:ABC-type Fe3+/spermidine/putrescine transport system ATPase subunit